MDLGFVVVGFVQVGSGRRVGLPGAQATFRGRVQGGARSGQVRWELLMGHCREVDSRARPGDQAGYLSRKT